MFPTKFTILLLITAIVVASPNNKNGGQEKVSITSNSIGGGAQNGQGKPGGNSELGNSNGRAGIEAEQEGFRQNNM